MESIVLGGLLGLSVLGHFVHYLSFRHSLKTHRKLSAEKLAAAAEESAKAVQESAKRRPLDVSAEELLRELVSSGAIVRIERIDPESLLMWRPK